MGHAYSSQVIENLKVKDIAQRLGLGKRGSCDLDWGQFDWYHGMYVLYSTVYKKLGMQYEVLLRQTPDGSTNEKQFVKCLGL